MKTKHMSYLAVGCALAASAVPTFSGLPTAGRLKWCHKIPSQLGPNAELRLLPNSWNGTSWAWAQSKPAPEHVGKPSKGFEQLKSLVGEWEGNSGSGMISRVSYQLASGGTALLERLKTGDEPEMLTVYTPDGDRLAVTHFCSAGNQPQMRTAPITGEVKQLSFGFVRATNLASLSEGHMDHLVVTLQGKDHFTQEWTWSQEGKTKTEAIHFTRKN